MFCNSAFGDTLVWNANTETDLAGYKVYSGTTSGNYASAVDVGNTTQYQLTNLVTGTTYFFALTAYNTSGLESDFSTEVSYTPPASNTPPTISSFSPRTISEDTNSGPIAFTIGDAETPGALTLNATSSNPSLVPAGGMTIGGSGTNRTLGVTPAANQSGMATITVRVSDGQLSASNSFALTVSAVNDAPTIGNVADRTIDQDTVTGPISFTVSDVETAASSLALTGRSSNPTLVPNQNIVFGGSGSNRTVNVTPATNQSGVATIAVAVSDGSSTATNTWVLTVRATTTNTPPALTSVRNTTIFSGGTSLPLRFAVSDAEISADALLVRASSSNPALIPDNTILFGGSGTNRHLTVSASSGQVGDATITLSVEDDRGGTDSTNFTVRVVARPVNLVYMPFEAEAGTVVAPMMRYTNSSTIYVATTAKGQGRVTFKISVPEAGNYVIWARHLSPNSTQDSFNVVVDGVRALYATTDGTWSTNWQWSRVNSPSGSTKNDPRVLSLTAGAHTINFRGRDVGCALDSIIVCNDLEFVPADGPNAAIANLAVTTDEVNAGTDLPAPAQEIEVNWKSTPGLTYKVQGKRDAVSAWVDVSQPITANDVETSWMPPEDAPFEYYRVVLVGKDESLEAALSPDQ